MRSTILGPLVLLILAGGEAVFDESLPTTFIGLDLLQDEGKAVDNRRLTRHLQGQNTNGSSNEILPLFQGMGTHYSYIYVGTPPQRVSVIVDTGSHHTAFPCVGCNCGQHMNSPFDPVKSNSSKIFKCLGRRCFFQQSYSEGSSWHAYKVADKMWMGGVSETSISSASRYSIDFQFGCQDSETGLFRTQHVDGIMGMSAAEDTIPHQLVTQQITKSRIFALCFSIGGGVLTLGGVDQTLHKTGALIQYAKLLKPKGWFTVKLLDVSMRASLSSKHLAVMKRTRTNSSKNSTYSINADVAALNFKKGVIVDSGTTDTYLPISVRDLFEKLFRKVTDGITYTNSNIALSRSQLEKLPTIIYTLEGEEGSPPVEIESEPSSYMERLGDGKFAFRIYLTESAGAILGANVMNNHNVIFDIDNKRIGFVSSECKYENGRNYGTSLMHVDPDPSMSPDSNMNSLELFQKSLSSFTSSLLGY